MQLKTTPHVVCIHQSIKYPCCGKLCRSAGCNIMRKSCWSQRLLELQDFEIQRNSEKFFLFCFGFCFRNYHKEDWTQLCFAPMCWDVLSARWHSLSWCSSDCRLVSQHSLLTSQNSPLFICVLVYYPPRVVFFQNWIQKSSRRVWLGRRSKESETFLFGSGELLSLCFLLKLL